MLNLSSNGEISEKEAIIFQLPSSSKNGVNTDKKEERGNVLVNSQ